MIPAAIVQKTPISMLITTSAMSCPSSVVHGIVGATLALCLPLEYVAAVAADVEEVLHKRQQQPRYNRGTILGCSPFLFLPFVAETGRRPLLRVCIWGMLCSIVAAVRE
jgi:hypothetical protein